MANYLDYTGLTHYDGKVKEYVLQKFLLRKNYDLTKEAGVDSDIAVDSKEWDDSEGKWKFGGNCVITLPRKSTVYTYISVAKKSNDATITIGSTTYSNNYVFARSADAETVTIVFNGTFWLNYIKVEELSYEIPTKTSQLTNDAKFVTANMSGDTLIINDGTIQFS